MEEYIKKIDWSTETLTVLNIQANALKDWVSDIINTKEYSYIKGYADCKIKQLQK